MPDVLTSKTPNRLDQARRVAAAVVDPELPMLTLADLGVLRAVEVRSDDRVVVTITPTYSGCPALVEMRADLRDALLGAGFRHVEVRTELDPPWSTELITAPGRQALAEHGISPPGPVAATAAGPVPLTLVPPRRALRCPRCGSVEVALISEFGATACQAQYRCRSCREPFDHVKEI